MSWLVFLRDNKAIPRRQSADITAMERTAGKVIPKMVKTESKKNKHVERILRIIKQDGRLLRIPI